MADESDENWILHFWWISHIIHIPSGKLTVCELENHHLLVGKSSVNQLFLWAILSRLLVITRGYIPSITITNHYWQSLTILYEPFLSILNHTNSLLAMKIITITHRIHVWYIYKHWGYIDGVYVTIYSIRGSYGLCFENDMAICTISGWIGCASRPRQPAKDIDHSNSTGVSRFWASLVWLCLLNQWLIMVYLLVNTG